MNAFLRILILVFLISFQILICVPDTWAQTSLSGELDIAELVKVADRTFDLDSQDAVILFDGYEVYQLQDERLKRRVHRIVWLSGSSVKGHYADHRIPYDDAHQTFTVEVLRTWRDGEWWDSDTTGIVETLPFAVQKAYDYSTMREMMLLHDGVELPCILEVVYLIEDKAPSSNQQGMIEKDYPPRSAGGESKGGAEGLYLFAKEDPVVISQFSLGLPSGGKPHVFASEEVPGVVVETDEELDLDVYTYRMERLPAVPRPHTIDPASYTPHVVWSTWESWQKYGSDLKRSFESALELDDALKDSLEDLLDDARALTEKASLIAEFVKRSTRYINYSERYWIWYPRKANRTYTTGYGHRLDRAILAAALFREAGFLVFPFYRSEGYGDINEGVASTSRMDGIGVWISGKGEVEAYYDPVASKVHNGLSPIFGHTIWIPGSGDKPAVTWRGEGIVSKLEVRLSISYDSEDELWHGRGFYKTTQGFTPFDRMEGLDDQAKDYLQSVVAGVLKGAEVMNYNPVIFNRFTIALGFEFTVPPDEEDSFGRFNLTIGEPAGGILAMVPEDVSLYMEERGSPVRLPGQMEQVVELSLDSEGWGLIYLPEDRTLENDAGSFSLQTVEKDDRIKITRLLNLGRAYYTAGDWDQLRKLLLSDQNERSRTVLLRKTD